MATTSLGDVLDSIRRGDDDTALDVVIGSYLHDNKIQSNPTAEQIEFWRVDYGNRLRIWGYPDMFKYMSIFPTGTRPDDPNAMDSYFTQCSNVNARFPIISI